MVHVVFIAPRFLENTNRYVRAFAELDGVTLTVVSADPEAAIPAPLRPRIAGHYRVADALDGGQLTTAVRAIARGVGPVDRVTGALEQLQLPLAEVRDALDIDGLRAATARNFRDKDRMKEVLRRAGVPVATSALARSAAELRAFVDRVGYPVIVKPPAGLGARATFRVDDAAQLAAVPPPTAAAPLQVEEFVRAREHTCETVTIRGAPVWRSGTRYFPSPLEVLETPWVQYCVLLPREDDDPTWTDFHPTNAAALAALFGDAAGTAAGTALTHMEWFLRTDGTALVNEVGVRPPGVHIMPLMGLAHDTDLIADWARLIALDAFTPRPRRRAAGAAFFRGQGPGTHVAAVEGVDEAVRACGDALVELRAPRVGQARADSYEGEGWATVQHATTDGAKHALRALIERVVVRYR
ncbi:MAG: ATP-grasp domain-containing protein [Myxococcales bacterium]|nr:ATP-grasp domain-containing protein [Myxococcales bacterium]